jgi:hypothetical protein
MTTIAIIIAAILAIFGILRLIRGDILVGVVLIVLAFIVGPGGYSILD